MNKLIVAAGLAASLLLAGAADAQRYHSRDSGGQRYHSRDSGGQRYHSRDSGGWHWSRHNAGTFRNRGQCQKALMSERNMARRDASRHRVNPGMFNQRWRLRCIATRQRGRLVYRIR